MPTTLAPVQFAETSSVLTASGTGTFTGSVSLAFTTNVTAGNCLVVALFGATLGPGTQVSAFSISDTLGNTYTLAKSANSGGNTSPPGFGVFVCTPTKGGANTVTVSFSYGSIFVTQSTGLFLMMSEYAMPTAAIQDAQFYQIYGAGGNSPITVNITDSHTSTIGVTFQTGTTPFGPGSISAGVVLDLLTDGVNYLLALFCGNDGNGMIPPTTTPSGYATFQFEQTAGPQNAESSTLYAHWYDIGSITLTLALGANTLQIGALCSGYFQLSAVFGTGGVPPYSYSITAGALPPGLTLDSTTGSISGTTQDQPGVYNFTATVTDSTSATASLPLSITIEDVYGVTDPQIILQLSNDGGKTWGPERSTSLGRIGAYNTLVRWRAPNGRSNNRAIRVICSEPVDVSLLAMDFDVTS